MNFLRSTSFFSASANSGAVLFVIVAAAWNPVAAQNRPLDFSCVTFHAYLSETELIAEFGRENVSRGPVVGSDDGPVEGTILFADQPGKRVEIAWNEMQRRENPLWIRVQGNSSLWRTPNGIALGDDLLTIEKRNGWPFRIFGFTSEGNGQLRDWGNGRLQLALNCAVRVTFQPVPGSNDALLRQVTQLPSVSSGHPAMQKINPRVVAIWIRHFPNPLPMNAADALLDVLVFGADLIINPALYDPETRGQLEHYLRHAEAYVPRTMPSADMKMEHTAQTRYEVRLMAQTDNPNASALAQDYVKKLRPCYEWEGFHDCPEREAQFADTYLASNPNSPFREYLPLLSAHRWLCAAEGYEYEKDVNGASRSRSLFEQRVAMAREAKSLLIRKAAARLAERNRCLAP